jgi:hypothetical protein
MSILAVKGPLWTELRASLGPRAYPYGWLSLLTLLEKLKIEKLKIEPIRFARAMTYP